MPKLRIDGGACLLWAAGVLLLPLRWGLAALGAAAFHEGCHYLAAVLLGGRVYGIRLRYAGALMELEPLEPGRELICALAGPVGSLLLVSLGRWMPRVALCALCQSIYNLLPVYPLDGGRALRTLCRMLCRRGDPAAVERWVGGIVILGIAVASVALGIRLGTGFFLLFPVGLLVRTGFPEKYLAKLARRDYNKENYK